MLIMQLLPADQDNSLATHVMHSLLPSVCRDAHKLMEMMNNVQAEGQLAYATTI